MRESVPSPVKAVVFDVGRVLFEWDLRHLFRKLLSDAAEVERIVTEVVTEEWHFQHDAGRPLAEMVLERQAQFPADAHLIEAYAARFAESIPGPVPGSLDLVDALAARRVPLFAITNFGAEFWPPFRNREPVFDHFRDIVVSGIEQVAKPEAEIYHRAAARFGHAPHAMLFIDDNAVNVAAAAALGWQVHRFTDAETLRGDLAARGLIAPLP